MKKIIIISLIFVSLLYNSAWAEDDLVQIISSSYAISGWLMNGYGYDQSASFPITQSAGSANAFAQSSTGLYLPSVGSYSASAYAAVYVNYEFAQASASASWIFQPKSDINLSIYEYSLWMSFDNFILTDTSDRPLVGDWNVYHPYPTPPPPEAYSGFDSFQASDFSGILYAGNTYKLSFGVDAFAQDSAGYAGLWANFSSAPEPTTMLLLGLGLMGLAGVGRKFKT